MFTLASTRHLSQMPRLFDLNTPQNSSDSTVVGQVFKSNTPSIRVKCDDCSLNNEHSMNIEQIRPRMYNITIYDMQIASHSNSLPLYTYAVTILGHFNGFIRINGQRPALTDKSVNGFRRQNIRTFVGKPCINVCIRGPSHV